MMVVLADNSGENFGLDNLQVMKRLKFLLKSVTYPPSEIFNLLPFLIKFFSNTGSKIGSTVF
jgi:hypothetical protein